MNGATTYIPIEISVHLGSPSEPAYNVTISFLDYIKNVASSELYPTWPEASLRANIMAEISFALNRIYRGHYRSLGYDFDITNSPVDDQRFVYGRNIFQNINLLVNEQFDSYISRIDSIEPLLAVSCNGTTVTCNGLSKWGSVSLAEQGANFFEILKTYYGNDITIIRGTPVLSATRAYPGQPLHSGDSGEDVTYLQMQLNRISENYISIPKINPLNSYFDESTINAVYQFQTLFNLFQNGQVEEATWYTLEYAYQNARTLADLRQQSLLFEGKPQQYVASLSVGAVGYPIQLAQYYLNTAAFIFPILPKTAMSGIYGPETAGGIMIFQRLFSLPITGIIDKPTWNKLFDFYFAVFTVIPPADILTATQNYPETLLSVDSTGEPVKALQYYLVTLSVVFKAIPPPMIDGNFGYETQTAVVSFQKLFSLEATGIVNKATWDALTLVYSDLVTAYTPKKGQFPGYTLKEGMSDFENIYAFPHNAYP